MFTSKSSPWLMIIEKYRAFQTNINNFHVLLLRLQESKKVIDKDKTASLYRSIDRFILNWLFIKIASSPESSELENKFESKRRGESSAIAILLMHLVISVYTYFLFPLDICSNFAAFAISFSTVFSILNGFLIVLPMFFRKKSIEESSTSVNMHISFFSWVSKYASFMENLYCVSTCLSFCFILLIFENDVDNKEKTSTDSDGFSNSATVVYILT